MGMWYFVFSMVKTVDDHCGYALPWDPMQHISSNNAAYHDIHHQSWGIKSNFSQPFFTMWDRILGTRWTGDVNLKYERTRAAAAIKGSKNGNGAAEKENGTVKEPTNGAAPSPSSNSNNGRPKRRVNGGKAQ